MAYGCIVPLTWTLDYVWLKHLIVLLVLSFALLQVGGLWTQRSSGGLWSFEPNQHLTIWKHVLPSGGDYSTRRACHCSGCLGGALCRSQSPHSPGHWSPWPSKCEGLGLETVGQRSPAAEGSTQGMAYGKARWSTCTSTSWSTCWSTCWSRCHIAWLRRRTVKLEPLSRTIATERSSGCIQVFRAEEEFCAVVSLRPNVSHPGEKCENSTKKYQ